MPETATTFPFQIFGIDPSGVTLATKQLTIINTSSTTLLPGQTFEVDARVAELNTDANGVCWLYFDDEAQHAAWGRVRFGRGEVPAFVADAVQAARHAQLVAEKNNLLRTNPHLAKRTAGTSRLAEIEAELSA
jgi:hypothetical protein